MARRRRPRHGPPDLVCRRTDMQFSGMWQKVAMDADAAKKMNGAGDVLWVVMMAGDWSAVFPPLLFILPPFRISHPFPLLICLCANVTIGGSL